MRFSIFKAILSWQAWKRPQYRRSIRSRHASKKPKPLFPKSYSRRKARRTRRLAKRNPYRHPEKVKSQLFHGSMRVAYALILIWMIYETGMSLMLLE